MHTCTILFIFQVGVPVVYCFGPLHYCYTPKKPRLSCQEVQTDPNRFNMIHKFPTSSHQNTVFHEFNDPYTIRPTQAS